MMLPSHGATIRFRLAVLLTSALLCLAVNAQLTASAPTASTVPSAVVTATATVLPKPSPVKESVSPRAHLINESTPPVTLPTSTPTASPSPSKSIIFPLFDHRAHSVPGPDKTVRDDDGDGFATLTLNGELSHTHFFVPGPPAIVGRLVSFEWVEQTFGTTIGTSMSITHDFPVGVTTVTLTVLDNSGDSASDNVTVTVLPPGDQGAYMYFYDLSRAGVGESDVPVLPLPQHGVAIKSVMFPKPADFPDVPFISKGPFACRIRGNFLAILDDEYVFFIAHGGGAVQLTIDGQRVLSKLEPGTSDNVSVAKSIKLTKRQYSFDLVYYTADPSKAQLVLGMNLGGSIQTVPSSFLSYESSVVIPTLHKISPEKSTLGGGGHMKLTGSGFMSGSTVTVGPYSVATVFVKSDSEIHIKVPKAAAPADVVVTVMTSRGTSNPLHFTYTAAAKMPIKFKEKFLTYTNGTLYPSMQFTSVAIGPDLRYYFGSLDTHVYVLSVSHTTLNVHGACKSKSVGGARSITGVSFNPAEKTVRPYISTNTFYWRNWNLLSEKDGWHNGKIEILKRGTDPDDPEVCLIHDQDLVTGLPVSNHDHGINSIVWDNDGNLYVQVGGFTNAGVSEPDDLVGGVPESVLSAATVVVHLRAKGFDGKVVYDQYDDPGTAVKTSPDEFVEGFAFGFRNSYGSVFHTNGHIYATDNGPNKGYGAKSITCNTEGPDPWHEDSLVLVHEGGYFGFPNRARGSVGDTRQCVYYAPTETSRNGFTAALAVFEASTNGLVEYTANCFEGQMRGDLLVSKYAVSGKGKLYRVSLDATGKEIVGEVQELALFSGLSVTMNPFGALIMPRVQQPNIAVLVPDEEEYSGKEPRITAIAPNRGPKGGGNVAFISGHRLIEGVEVTFGTKDCKVLRRSTEDNWMACLVPPGSGAVKVTIITTDGVTSAITNDYWYLNF